MVLSLLFLPVNVPNDELRRWAATMWPGQHAVSTKILLRQGRETDKIHLNSHLPTDSNLYGLYTFIDYLTASLQLFGG